MLSVVRVRTTDASFGSSVPFFNSPLKYLTELEFSYTVIFSFRSQNFEKEVIQKEYKERSQYIIKKTTVSDNQGNPSRAHEAQGAGAALQERNRAKNS